MAGLQADSPWPTAITLHQRSRTLEVVFSDAKRFHIPFELMRVYSPSAEVQGHGPEQAVLQTGKREVWVVSVEPVGHYAIKPVFSDGHDSGIFTWEYLYFLGAQEADLWEQYEQRLRDAGMARDAPMKDRGADACGHHH